MLRITCLSEEYLFIKNPYVTGKSKRSNISLIFGREKKITRKIFYIYFCIYIINYRKQNMDLVKNLFYENSVVGQYSFHSPMSFVIFLVDQVLLLYIILREAVNGFYINYRRKRKG